MFILNKQNGNTPRQSWRSGRDRREALEIERDIKLLEGSEPLKAESLDENPAFVRTPPISEFTENLYFTSF